MLHCNGIDPFITLIGNFNWEPISHNKTVSKVRAALGEAKGFAFSSLYRIVNLQYLNMHFWPNVTIQDIVLVVFLHAFLTKLQSPMRKVSCVQYLKRGYT